MSVDIIEQRFLRSSRLESQHLSPKLTYSLAQTLWLLILHLHVRLHFHMLVGTFRPLRYSERNPTLLRCATPNQQSCQLIINLAIVISARAHLEMIAAIAIRNAAVHGLRDAMPTTTIGLLLSPSLYGCRSTRENSTVDTWKATQICSPTTSISKKDMTSTT
jgi:hypothetical protein